LTHSRQIKIALRRIKEADLIIERLENRNFFAEVEGSIFGRESHSLIKSID